MAAGFKLEVGFFATVAIVSFGVIAVDSQLLTPLFQLLQTFKSRTARGTWSLAI